jgi:hypothetical protein
MALTLSQQEFLCKSLHIDDNDALLQAYRDCGCEDADGTNQVVGRKIKKLLGRGDAQIFLAGQRAREQLRMIDAMHRADEEAADLDHSKTRLKRVALDTLTACILHEGQLHLKGKRTTIQGLAKACEVAEKLSKAVDEGQPLTEEEIKAALKEAGVAIGEEAEPVAIKRTEDPEPPMPSVDDVPWERVKNTS